VLKEDKFDQNQRERNELSNQIFPLKHLYIKEEKFLTRENFFKKKLFEKLHQK